MNMKNTLVISILVLLGAAGLGLVIKHIRMSQAVVEIKPESTPHTAVTEPKVVSGPAVNQKPQLEIKPERGFQAEEQDTAAIEEPAVKGPVEETQKVAESAEPQQEYIEPEPERPQWQFGSNFGTIRQFFTDLNLNEQEQARLQEGIMLRRQKFERMSEAERLEEFERMREMGERWQNMNEQEQNEVKSRMWERFEDWRRSDSIELPELTLD